MSKMQIPKKIRFEDFEGEQQDLIKRLGYALNPFFDELYSILNNNIDFNNLNRELAEVTINIDASGNLVNPPQIKLKILYQLRGMNVIRATNLINTNVYPLNSPFVSWTINGTIISILNVSGLQNNSQYSLLLELIG